VKRLAIRLITLAPIPVAMVLVNLSVDYAGLFHTDREHEIVGLLRAGNNVAVDVNNIDQRRLHRYYVESLTQAPDWVVLGSSRAMFIRHDMTPSDSFFNHAVFGAALEDFIGILGLYVSRGMFPKHVIVTIDPWIMNRLSDPPYWQSFRDVYAGVAQTAEISIDHGRSVFDLGNLNATKAEELLSPSYFQACLRQLLYEPRRLGPPPPVATDADPGDLSKILRDGSLLYPRSKYKRTPAEASLEIQARLTGLDSSGSFSRIDGGLKVALSRLVSYLARRGADVTLVLMPYHPLEYERMARWPGYSVATSVEEYARTMAEEEHVRYLGSYNPIALGCDESEFFDGDHPKPSCVAKVMEPLRAAHRIADRASDE
jgi:hypothetical protein